MGFFMLTFLALAASVVGATEPSCPAAADAIRASASEALALYDAFEFDAFEVRFDQLVAEVHCSDDVLSRADAFQLYQLQGLDGLLAEDSERMVAALRAMIAVRPDYTLPQELAAPGSTMAEAYTTASQAEPTAGKALDSEGTWYVDGVMGVIELPGARSVLVQHLEKRDKLTTWFLDGQSVPESLSEYLSDQAPASASADSGGAPAGTSDGGSAKSGGHLSRKLALGGAASAAVAVAGFVVAGSAYSRFPDAADREEAESLDALNQGAAVAGGVFAAAGGGLLVGALIRGEW